MQSVSANYNVTIEEGTLQILAREYKLKINNTSKKYGESEPVFSYTVLDDSDNILEEDNIVLVYSRASGENVGEYEITATLQSVSANYNVTIEKGKLTITKRTLTITATDVEITEGETPTFEYSSAGDSILNDDIQFELTCDDLTVGTHPINITITKNNDNYDVSCIAGTLTVIAQVPQE